MSEGELRLTGSSFDALKNSVDDLSRRAKIAKDSLESLFFVGYGRSYAEDIGKVANHFAKLEELIDGINNKLSITSAFMRDIFSGQASDIREVAKALSMMNRAASGGGSRRGGGGVAGGMGGEEGTGGSSGRQRDPDVTVRTHARVQANIRKAAERQAKLDEQFQKYKEKLRKQEEKDQISLQKTKAKMDKLSFVSELSLMESASRIGARFRKAQQSEEKRERDYNLKQEMAALDKQEREKKKQAERAAREEKNRTPFFEDKFNKLVEMGRRRFYISQVMGNNFGRAAGLGGGSGQGMLSRFGPGLLGILGRYRVFQKPFPGSERNVFALGDLAAAGQNVVSGAGGSVQRSFDTLTSSAFAVNRAFGGLVAATASLIPGLGPVIGAAIGVLTDVVIGTLEKLSQAVSGVIGGLTRLATALAGFATRAVEAAANFTEAVNAARVVAGSDAAASMQQKALELQREFGISATDMMRGMGRIAGQLRQQAGFSPEEAGETAQVIARQIADIASVNNTPVENVMRDFMSGIVGRLTPLRKNMISMSAQQLDMMAKSQGIKNPMIRTDLVARVKVMIDDFARQGGLFTGDLERTRYEFANQRRKFLGGFEALFMTVGRILEPFGRAVLIVANDLMDSVFSMIAPFAKDPYTAFKQSIETFAYYVLYAKNVVVSLAQSLYDSRGVILDYTQYFGKQLLQLTLVLVRYSANVLNVFAELLKGIAFILPALQMFGSALMQLSNFIYKIAPTTNMDALTKKNNLSNIESEIRQLESGRILAGPGGRSAVQKRLESLRLQREAAANEVSRLGSSPIAELLLGAGNALENTTQSLDAFQKQFIEAIKSLTGGTGVNDQDLRALLKKLEPVISKPNPIKPAPPLTMAGNLVRYFSPEAFRDNIQEREVQNAQIQTAQNTAKIVELIQGGAMAGVSAATGIPLAISRGASSITGGLITTP